MSRVKNALSKAYRFGCDRLTGSVKINVPNVVSNGGKGIFVIRDGDERF